MPTLYDSTKPTPYTRDIEKFSAKENFRKILKVSHFYLVFLWNENNDKMNQSHIVFSEFSGSYRIYSFYSLGPKISMKPCENV